MPSLVQTWALPVALLAIVNLSVTWFNVVSNQVPEPYLDEFFHVPQAQQFCKQDYSWDPKITTPPGLYLISILFEPLLGCETSSLRALNVGAICLICLLSYGMFRVIRARTTPTKIEKTSKSTVSKLDLDDTTVILDAHSALNIALFPPLFFFSGLYYTDVVSTLLVLVSYGALLKKTSPTGSIIENLSAILIGIMALLFRQTNIFWVAVFPAGLSVIDALKKDGHRSTSSNANDPFAILKDSWTTGRVHDRTVQDAEAQDYVLLVLSIALAAAKKPLLVLKVLIPYIVLLILFAGFVAWNGSVVLGDKTAHTATLHIPQMLYIWPYIAFFSAPLIVGPFIQPIASLMPQHLRTFCKDNYDYAKRAKPSLVISIFFILGGLAAVRFNTIVHPYTLADNRHYVFYVFRILRRHPAIKYLAVPVYYICAWLVTRSLGLSTNRESAIKTKREAHPTTNEADSSPCQASFILVWLAATALSVITAPLVEPRYFIVPWILWRLHLPYASASLSKAGSSGRQSYDMRLVLETVWLLAINGAVTYIFLQRGFTWPSEPGKIQRFIW